MKARVLSSVAQGYTSLPRKVFSDSIAFVGEVADALGKLDAYLDGGCKGERF